MKRVAAGAIGCLLLLSGCGSAAPKAGPGAAASGPPSAGPSASPSASPLPPAVLRDAALVPVSWQAPDGWAVSYDKDLDSRAVVGCNSWGLTPSDLGQHQREWASSDNSAGAGESSYVLGPTDTPTPSPGAAAPAASPDSGEGRAAAMVAALDADTAGCKHVKPVNGVTTTTLAAPALTLPTGGVHDAKVFCRRTRHAGNPDSYGCFAAAGKGDLFLQVYGFGRSLDQAATGLGALMTAEGPVFDALPA